VSGVIATNNNNPTTDTNGFPITTINNNPTTDNNGFPTTTNNNNPTTTTPATISDTIAVLVGVLVGGGVTPRCRRRACRGVFVWWARRGVQSVQ
jgi:hypothetical protein